MSYRLRIIMSYCSTRKSNTASAILRSTLNSCTVSSLSIIPTLTDSLIMVYFIAIYCLKVMLSFLHKSSYSRFTKGTRLSGFSFVSFRTLLVQNTQRFTLSQASLLSLFLDLSSFFFLFCSQSYIQPRVLKPFFFSSFSSQILCRISFSLMIPWTSFQCQSAELNLENTFIILYISFYYLVLVLSRRICSLRSKSLREMTNSFLLILSFSLWLYMSMSLNFMALSSYVSSSLNYISARSSSASLSYSTQKSPLFGMKPMISAGLFPVLFVWFTVKDALSNLFNQLRKCTLFVATPLFSGFPCLFPEDYL